MEYRYRPSGSHLNQWLALDQLAANDGISPLASLLVTDNWGGDNYKTQIPFKTKSYEEANSMTQDFAKIRPEPILEQRVVQAPPAWSLMLTGVVVGAAIGVFACVMFYLSGKVPPLSQDIIPSQSAFAAEAPDSSLGANEQSPSEPEINFEFYRELQDYEVEVDSVPVELTREQAGITELETPFLLQSGAFESRESAENAQQRQELLGLQINVKQQELVGRTLFLLQSGPYTTTTLLQEAESLLRSNDIPHIRLKLQ